MITVDAFLRARFAWERERRQLATRVHVNPADAAAMVSKVIPDFPVTFPLHVFGVEWTEDHSQPVGEFRFEAGV